MAEKHKKRLSIYCVFGRRSLGLEGFAATTNPENLVVRSALGAPNFWNMTHMKGTMMNAKRWILNQLSSS